MIALSPPKRLEILKRLTTQLNRITIENGYSHDVSGKVWRGRNTFGDNDEVPMLSILESPRADLGFFAGDSNNARQEDWVLLIQGWGMDDPLHPTDPGYYLAADVEKCLSEIMMLGKNGRPENAAVYRLGDLISDFEMSPPVVRPPDDLSSKAYFYMPVRLKIAVNLADPYCLE